MRIENAKIFMEDGHFCVGAVSVRDGVILEVKESGRANGPAGAMKQISNCAPDAAYGSAGAVKQISNCAPDAENGSARPSEQVYDAQGAYLLPGFIDLHFHGAVGDDVCDGSEEALHRIAAYELSVGVTSICPATMALPLDELKRVLNCLSEFPARQLPGEAELVGINMEAPFISPAKKGAQDARYIIPRSSSIFRELYSASGGLVRFIGIAPEEPSEESVADFIRKVSPLADVSLAHTNAGYDCAMEAFSSGANHAVHLYNAMTGMSHREPGCVGAAADSPHVLSELISDGVHVHPAVIRTTFRMFGAERIILISDSMRATGLTDGRYTLGGLEVEVQGKTARLTSDGAIAGSVTNLPDCVRYAVSLGIPLEDAVAAATANPARALHMEDRIGKIAPGCQADLVLWRPDLTLKAVVKKGRFVGQG